MDRRSFFRNAGRAAGGLGLCALGLAALGRPQPARAGLPVRPPGALPDADFLAACLRCGLCVRDCPYDTLSLAELDDGPAVGTPFFRARAVPCEMCEDIPCVKACPSGALDPSLTDIKKARMGTAVLIDQENCLNFLGLRCDVCHRVCPLMGEAITLEQSHNERTGKHARFLPTVHADKCTGCGKCEKACVLDEAAIKVLPTELARGRLGRHYRLGWEEKRLHGEAVPGVIDLPDRGWEGTPLKGFKP